MTVPRIGNQHQVDKKVIINPCQDPISLARQLVRTFSKKGTYVADFCAGSGTFALAAVLEKRHAFALDTDAKQLAGLKERLASVQRSIDKEHSSAKDEVNYRLGLIKYRFLSSSTDTLFEPSRKLRANTELNEDDALLVRSELYRVVIHGFC